MSVARPLRSVAIVGRGPALWLAGIALHRAFAPLGLEIAVVETPSAGPSREVIAALPELARFHRLLGIADADLVRHADMALSLGQEFMGWGEGDGFLHVYGETGAQIGDMPFVPLFTRARAAGLRVPYDAFGAAGAGARLGRVDPAMPYGYHLNGDGYQAVLARHAAKLGIRQLRDPAPTAMVAGGHIECVRLSTGEEIAADLYVDASDGGLLIDALDRRAALVPGRGSPCDRMLMGSAAPLSPLPLYSRIAAHRAGWVGLFPLAARTGVTFAYASDAMSDDEAARAMQAEAGVAISGAVEVHAIEDRIRTQPWVANCVAVGAAMASGDPIDAVRLHRTQIALTHLIALLPVNRDDMIERAIFNEDVVAHLVRVRDFQAAHYRLNGRGEDFWNDARDAPISADLSAKIDLFAARAMLAQHNHETFNPDSWHALLIGHGVVPRSWDPQADRIADADLIPALQRMLGSVKDKVGGMIPHEAARAAA